MVGGYPAMAPSARRWPRPLATAGVVRFVNFSRKLAAKGSFPQIDLAKSLILMPLSPYATFP